MNDELGKKKEIYRTASAKDLKDEIDGLEYKISRY